MPAFGEMLAPEEIDALVNHVLAISGQEYDAVLADTGAVLFADNCAACHGDKGEGNHDVGAPTLSDAIWLYGGDPETLKHTITYARFGVMPAWSEEWRPGGGGLTQAEINAVATYVHQLGGGQ
jgi:cytochrome c oxidase cbb3-type subunit 3